MRTSPVEIPLWGKLKFSESTKESLLEIWGDILRKTALMIHTDEKVVDIQHQDGYFLITTMK